VSDDTAGRHLPNVSPRTVAVRVAMLVIGAVAFYVLLPQLLDLFAQVPNLGSIRPWWFVVMAVLEVCSFVCMWELTRVALPQVSWFVAATSHLTSNAVSRAVPGGAAVGTATGFRMLAVSGVERGRAGTALAANSFISNGVLFAIPTVALIASILGAPIPDGLHVVAWGGAGVFVVMFVLGFVLVRFDRPLYLVAGAVERVAGVAYRRLGRPGAPTTEGIVDQRDAMVHALGTRWHLALGASIGNWLFDYLALVAALYAVGAHPRPSLILLAYGFAAVLGMIPITPGGLGFVEAGLVGMLTLSHVSASDALLATLAYRIVSFWLPLPAGGVAYLLFRHRYGHPPVDQATDGLVLDTDTLDTDALDTFGAGSGTIRADAVRADPPAGGDGAGTR